jgi:hypothetical protein
MGQHSSSTRQRVADRIAFTAIYIHGALAYARSTLRSRRSTRTLGRQAQVIVLVLGAVIALAIIAGQLDGLIH